MARVSKARQEIADYTRDIQEYDLAKPVTPQQRKQLRRMRYTGPTPCSSAQAKQILAKLKKGGSRGA